MKKHLTIWRILRDRAAVDKAICALENAASDARSKAAKLNDRAYEYWLNCTSVEMAFNGRKISHLDKLNEQAVDAWREHEERDYAAFRLRRVYDARNGDAEARRECLHIVLPFATTEENPA